MRIKNLALASLFLASSAYAKISVNQVGTVDGGLSYQWIQNDQKIAESLSVEIQNLNGEDSNKSSTPLRNGLQQIAGILQKIEDKITQVFPGNLIDEETSKVSEVKYLPLNYKEISEVRRKQIKSTNPDYKIKFDFDKSEKIYGIDMELTLAYFDQSISDEFLLDFVGGNITDSIKVNGKVVDFRYDGRFIRIPSKFFKNGSENSIAIKADVPFRNTGTGISRFTDSKTGAASISSQLQLQYGPLAFPGLHQTNIKQTHSVELIVPNNFVGFSNGEFTEEVELGNNKKLLKFKKTKPALPYLFAILTGNDYEVINVDEDVGSVKKMRFFVRKELKEKFERLMPVAVHTTKTVVKYMKEAYQKDYPWGDKLEAGFAMNFPWGAMENMALNIFAERVIPSSKVLTSAQLIRFIMIICHEIYHQWIGNLQSGQGEDGQMLAIHESMAEYFGFKIAEKAINEINLDPAKYGLSAPISSPWLSWIAGVRPWGLEKAVVPGVAHKIIRILDDEDSLESSFDGIGYAMGGSFERYLNWTLGDATYEAGLAQNLAESEYDFTTVEKRFQAIRDVGGDVDEHAAQDWYHTEGVNEIFLERIGNTEIKLTQTKFTSPILRPMKALVGLYQLVDGKLIPDNDIPEVMYEFERDEFKPNEDTASVSLPVKAAHVYIPDNKQILPGLVYLDQLSFDVLKDYLHTIDDAITRARIYESALWMLKHNRISVNDVVDLVGKNIVHESEELIATMAWGLLGAAIEFSRPEEVNEIYVKRAQIARSLYLTHSTNKLNLPEGELGIAKSESLLRVIRTHQDNPDFTNHSDFLTGLIDLGLGEDYEGVEIDQTIRWELVNALARLGDDKFNFYGTKVFNESQKNTRNNLALTLAKDLIPDPEVKKNFWEEFLSGNIGVDRIIASGRVGILESYSNPESIQFVWESFLENYDKFINLRSKLQVFALSMIMPDSIDPSFIVENEAKLMEKADKLSLAAKDYLMLKIHHAKLRKTVFDKQ